ncbi:MAG: chorismate-binding protein [Elusimicrobia bacterium]|nr:chorismate-binding protein [Elusimicrobiota bacterium]
MRHRRQKTLSQVKQAFRKGYNAVPLIRELAVDTFTPVEAFLRLTRGGGPSFLLESVDGGERVARYSFLGYRPFESISVRDGKLFPEGRRYSGGPFRELGRRLTRFRAPREPGLPRFCGGAVGYAGYEMFRHLEPSVPLVPPPDDEARFMLFSNIVVFDRVRQSMFLIANVLDGPRPADRYRAAVSALDEMERRLLRPVRAVRPAAAAAGPGSVARAILGRRAFCEGVRRIKRHIRAGDIFQAVLSDRFALDLKVPPFSVYRALRAINPSPYMFYMDFGDRVALGASPEMLLRLEDGAIETRPIAGTRPRGLSEKEDERQKKNLLASVKERAEHVMLVDLGRNDIGRVARPGSVRVPSFMQVERYSHVMHLVSSVRGRLKAGMPPWEAFASCFPAGTVTGAPKIRAMQILSGIEPVPRGLYAGAAVYCDFGGNIDSAIAIRSLYVRRRGGKRTAFIQAGAGIVADSKPELEYREVRNKARAMLEAIRRAGGGP